MKGINEKIDAYVKKTRRQTVITAAVLLILIIPVYLWFMMPNMGATSIKTGEVIRLVGLPSDEGDKLYLKVKLDNGDRVVHVRVHQRMLYQQGDKVHLEKQDALVFGRATYRLTH